MQILTTSTGIPYRFETTGKMAEASNVLSNAVSTTDTLSKDMERALAFEAHFSAALDEAPADAAKMMEALRVVVGNLNVAIDSEFLDSMMTQIIGAPVLRVTSISEGIPAEDVPDCLRALCTFLGDRQYHPLIKAAIAQAYVLIVRPYIYGNGRLARALSLMVLLRSGYTFLLERGLSEVFARHKAEYDESIMSTEDGDLTDFISFFLDMLVETLSTNSSATIMGDTGDTGATEATEAITTAQEITSTSDTKTGNRAATEAIITAQEITSTDGLKGDKVAARFYSTLSDLDRSRYDSVRQTASCVRILLKEGIHEFTKELWMERTGQTSQEYKNSRNSMLSRGLITNTGKARDSRYVFNLPTSPAPENDGTQEVDDAFYTALAEMESSAIETIRNTAYCIRLLLKTGIQEFTRAIWIEKTGQTDKEFITARAAMSRKGMIRNLEKPGSRKGRYVFNLKSQFAQRKTKKRQEGKHAQ